MFHILRTSTEHKTASLADEGNSAYCQSSGAHNIKHRIDALAKQRKYKLTIIETFIILEVTPVTNIGLYYARNVTISVFKSFRKTRYLGKNITRRLAHDKFHSICIHSPVHCYYFGLRGSEL